MIRKWLWAGSLAAAAAMATPAVACLNSYSLEIKMLLQRDNRELALRVVEKLEKDFETDQSARATNDLAVARILFGRVDEAIVLLKDLEQRHPGKAATAANLGTAFELTGNDQAALEWIREGMRRDPKEHQGTEWVHVRILEAKLALKADVNWLDTHSVMGLSFGDGPMPVEPAAPVDHLGQVLALSRAGHAIAYQLLERTLLVKPKDRVVADLYMTSGDIFFLSSLKEAVANDQRLRARRALEAYEGALRYGDPRMDLIKSRMAELERLTPDPFKKP